MRMILISAVATTFGIVLTLCCALGLTPRQVGKEGAAAPSQLKWDQYSALADVISTLPAWTKEGALTEPQWKLLAETATALASLSQQDMERVLIAYMIKYASNLRPETEDPDPRTKPLLLLATMFDLEHPYQQDMDAMYRDRDANVVQVCGGFFWNAGRHLERLERFALPVSWGDAGPRITAQRVTNVSGGSGEPHHPYQPHIEYRHFKQYYPIRWNFKPFAIDSGLTWRSILAQSNDSRIRSAPR